MCGHSRPGPLARARRLLPGAAAFRGGLGRTAFSSALLRRTLVGLLPASRAALLAAAGHGVNRSPRAFLGGLAAFPALLVAVGDVLRLPLLLAAVAALVALGHDRNLRWSRGMHGGLAKDVLPEPVRLRTEFSVALPLRLSQRRAVRDATCDSMTGVLRPERDQYDATRARHDG